MISKGERGTKYFNALKRQRISIVLDLQGSNWDSSPEECSAPVPGARAPGTQEGHGRGLTTMPLMETQQLR